MPTKATPIQSTTVDSEATFKDSCPPELFNIISQYPGSPTIRGMLEVCFDIVLPDPSSYNDIRAALIAKLKAGKIAPTAYTNVLSESWQLGYWQPHALSMEQRSQRDYEEIEVLITGTYRETRTVSYGLEETIMIRVPASLLEEAWENEDCSSLEDYIRFEVDYDTLQNGYEESELDQEDRGDISIGQDELQDIVTSYHDNNNLED